MRLAWLAALTKEKRKMQMVLVGKPKEGRSLQFIGVDSRVILKWIWKN